MWTTGSWGRTARDIADERTRQEVSVSLGAGVHDPTDPIGRLLFNILGMVRRRAVASKPQQLQ